MYDFGLASSGIMFVLNFIKIHPVVFELKLADTTSPVCGHFMHTVHRTPNKAGCDLDSGENF
jgi:hypothetical protein